MLARKELLRQPPVFGGDRQPAAMTGAEFRSDIAEIGHAVHIQPDFRHGDHDVGMTETEAGAKFHLRIGIGQSLAHKVLTRHAEIHRARADLAGDLGGRQIGDLDIVPSFDTAAIGAVIADCRDLQSGAFQNGGSVFLHPALGGQCDGDHGLSLPRTASMRSSQSEKPTAGIFSCAPSSVSSRSKRPPPARTLSPPASTTSKTRPV
ncbi:hypothetical protein D3C78_1086050 [compost metagenome]